MTTTYPGTLDSFTTKVDNSDYVLAAHVNNLQDSLVAVETELGTDPAGSATNLKTRLSKSLDAAGMLNFNTASTLTISGGTITATQNFHRVDTEGAASTDNLDTITAGAEGFVLVLHPVSDARDIVIRHDYGNILCLGGSNITLGTAADLVILIYDDVLDNWLAFSVTGAGLLGGANTWTGQQIWQSGESHKVSSINANTTLDATYSVVLVDASGGAKTVTLPAASSNTGRQYTIVKSDDSANAVTIDANSSETINGSLTHALSAQYSKVVIVCDGSNWIEVG